VAAAAPVVANINNATLNQAAPFLIIVKKVQLKLRSATKQSVDGPQPCGTSGSNFIPSHRLRRGRALVQTICA